MAAFGATSSLPGVAAKVPSPSDLQTFTTCVVQTAGLTNERRLTQHRPKAGNALARRVLIEGAWTN